MSVSHGQYLGGVRDIASLRDRCRIDECTGCWRYALCTDSKGARVQVRLADGRMKVLRGRRAALVVASGGLELPPGVVAYQAAHCKTAECVRPDHSAAGTRFESQRAAAARGAFDTPARLIALNAIQQGQRKVTVEQTLEIAASEGTCDDVAARYGISAGRVAHIRRGKCNQRARPASVFEWRP